MLWRIYILIHFIIFSACREQPDEIFPSTPQHAGPAVLQQIVAFSDTVDILSKSSSKQESLVYTLGDYSFYTSRFLSGSKVLLYIEHGSSGEYGTTERKFYLKDGNVVLTTVLETNLLASQPFRFERSYYKEGELLYSEYKEASTFEDLFQAEFKRNSAPPGDVPANLRKLNDALYQKGEFNLVFEGIAKYPKAKYLIFSRKGINTYRAPVLVEKEDKFTEALFTDPEKFKGRKLKIYWDIRVPYQAVYVAGKFN